MLDPEADFFLRVISSRLVEKRCFSYSTMLTEPVNMYDVPRAR